MNYGIGIPFQNRLGGMAFPSGPASGDIQYITGYVDGAFVDKVGVLDLPEVCDVQCLEGPGTITTDAVESGDTLTQNGTAVLTAGDGLITIEDYTLGEEEVENGRFDTDDLSSWGVASAGTMAVVDGKLRFGDTSGGRLIQTLGFIAGKSYKYSITLSEDTGSVSLRVYSSSSAFTIITGAGTYTGTVNVTEDISTMLSPKNDVAGFSLVDDVSITEVVAGAGTVSGISVNGVYTFPCEQEEGTTVYDVTGNGENGTVATATWTTSDDIPSYLLEFGHCADSLWATEPVTGWVYDIDPNEDEIFELFYLIASMINDTYTDGGATFTATEPDLGYLRAFNPQTATLNDVYDVAATLASEITAGTAEVYTIVAPTVVVTAFNPNSDDFTTAKSALATLLINLKADGVIG